MINFLISRNNTNSQSTEQQCDAKKENHQTRGYHLIEHHILKDIFITHVWQTVKRIDLNNYLGGERTCSFKAAHGVFSARTIPQLVTTGTHWFCDMVCVHCRTSWYNYNRLAEGFTRDTWLHPKINKWCMNFIERQGMVRFEVFPIRCMMHEILLKIHWIPEFFFTKKIVGWKSVVSYSPVFFY